MFKRSCHRNVFDEVASLNIKLQQMAEQRNYQFIQINGQRIFSPIDEKSFIPPRGTEIFVGRIPKNIFEDELIPMFETVGPIYTFRLMLDFSHRNRGFAFATYMRVQDANEAIRKFNNYQIRKYVNIGVFKSVDNCRLFFGNIPQAFNKADVLKILNENYVEGVVDIIMYMDHAYPNLNRGFVFVEFTSHREAAMARKQLYPGCLTINGEAIFVDWADPIPDVDPDVMAKVTKIFLHHLPVELPKEDLAEEINSLINPSVILKIHKHMDYAFVHFVNRSTAEFGLAALRGLCFNNKAVKVEWARPRIYSKQNRLASPPSTFCLSLPPKMRRHVQEYIAGKMSDSTSSSSSSNSPPHKNSTVNTIPPQQNIDHYRNNSSEGTIIGNQSPTNTIPPVQNIGHYRSNLSEGAMIGNQSPSSTVFPMQHFGTVIRNMSDPPILGNQTPTMRRPVPPVQNFGNFNLGINDGPMIRNQSFIQQDRQNPSTNTMVNVLPQMPVINKFHPMFYQTPITL